MPLKRLTSCVLFSTAFLSAGLSQASLIGSTVQLEAAIQSYSSPLIERYALSLNPTVSASQIEFTSTSVGDFETPKANLNPPNMVVDIGADFVHFDFSNAIADTFSSGKFVGFIFTFGSPELIKLNGAKLVAAERLRLRQSDISIFENQLLVNFNDLPFSNQSRARLQLSSEVLTPPTLPTEVPAPASLPLLLIGALSMIALRRRRAVTAATA
ncbi:PEP-CTERM sorting domain-containing protein [Allohahella marinimesophila]|uniref:Secreted protein n=1 Tax=Allohahella marinimesophila TaxID=1054972 RepID=A0ABP7Q6I1_9GAMM